MSLQIYTPSPILRPYVKMLWAWDGYHPPHTHERILPFAAVELTVNLTGEPLCFAYPEDHYQPHSIPGLIVSGARSRYFVVETARPAHLFSVLFQAAAARLFFGVSARALSNLHLPLCEVWGYSADALYEGLMTARTSAERCAILEAHLLVRLHHAPAPHPAVAFAVQSFHRAAVAPSIAHVVDRIALSPTRFIQVFQDEVGLTPKQFCRVQRFQQSLQMITQRPVIDWADLALAAGYYDQAHFINEFRQFAGITPTQFAPQSAEHPGNLPFVNPG
jgi:AraC-like DNA-binding protein